MAALNYVYAVYIRRSGRRIDADEHIIVGILIVTEDSGLGKVRIVVSQYFFQRHVGIVCHIDKHDYAVITFRDHEIRSGSDRYQFLSNYVIAVNLFGRAADKFSLAKLIITHVISLTIPDYVSGNTETVDLGGHIDYRKCCSRVIIQKTNAVI